MSTIFLEVSGMNCGGCVKSVTAALKPLSGVRSVEVDLPTGHVTVDGELVQGGESLAQALTAAGYPAKVITSSTVPTSIKKSGGCCG